MKIRSVVEPCLIVETGCLHNQRLALPMTTRIAHPRFVTWIACEFSERNPPDSVDILRQDHHLVARLQYLNWIRQIHRARYTREITLFQRVGRVALCEVLLLLFECPRLIRNTAVDRIHNDAEAR